MEETEATVALVIGIARTIMGVRDDGPDDRVFEVRDGDQVTFNAAKRLRSQLGRRDAYGAGFVVIVDVTMKIPSSAWSKSAMTADSASAASGDASATCCWRLIPASIVASINRCRKNSLLGSAGWKYVVISSPTKASMYPSNLL